MTKPAPHAPALGVRRLIAGSRRLGCVPQSGAATALLAALSVKAPAKALARALAAVPAAAYAAATAPREAALLVKAPAKALAAILATAHAAVTAIRAAAALAKVLAQALAKLPARILAAAPALAVAAAPALLPAAALAQRLPDFASLVEDNKASIVEISTTRALRPRAVLPDNRLEDWDWLRRFLPDQLPDFDPDELLGDRRPGAVGSGFVISADGYVVTNNHVVEGADEIHVHLNNRRQYRAEVIGLDEPSDLALLKIDARDLPAVEFGDSDRLRVGDWVLAIGSPFGLEFSAAAGIVSAKGRAIPTRSSYNYMSFIQTDVAINRGNSGGPLFNLAGEVVGINSQILSSSGGSNGISFAIPSNVALNVIAQLRENGRVERGLLGVRMREVTHALAETFDLPRPVGAFVDDITPAGPAAAGGVRAEDVIVDFNGHEIEYYTDLPYYVGQYRPGAKASLRVFRDGDYLDLAVELGSSPTNTDGVETAAVTARRANPMGLRVAELSAETRQVTGLEGVRITAVDSGPGRVAGLREGDVIIALDRRPVTSVAEFQDIVASLPAAGFVALRIVREGQRSTLTLELDP